MQPPLPTAIVTALLLLLPPPPRERESVVPPGWNETRMHGFVVQIKAAFAKSPLHDEVIALLGQQLFTISRTVAAEPLAKLRAIAIWVGDEAAIHARNCMFYHPSAQWLGEHERGREFMAKGVEIANAENFLGWCHQQPFMVLHELAHGYHDQVLGYGHAGVRAAFGKCKQAGIYDKVLHIQGGEQRHYALTNEQEWFAETTEAYFGTNDFYPFVRAELRRVDPQGFAELQRIWGDPRR